MFLAPAFLLGLLAIGVPLWLHRVARANPTRHPFGSLMLLEASETQRTARRTLRYWLLLAARILLLLALALAFAGPLVTERIIPRPGSQARLHAIVLDTSLSMQYGTRWQQAVSQAEALLGELKSSDRVMLVTAAGRHIDVVHSSLPAADAGVVRATLHRLKPGIERLDYGLAMSAANNWLGSPRPPVVLHLITDFQQSAAPLRFADLEPPSATQLVVHDVGDDAENTFISSAALTAPDAHSLQVTVRSTAAEPQRRAAILLVDNKVVARKEIEIPAAAPRAAAPPGEGEGSGSLAADLALRTSASSSLGSTSVAFTDLKLAPGAHRIEVSLEPRDSLPQDDHFRAVVQHANPKALLITAAANADDTAYFGAAIGSLSAPRLEVEQRTADAISSSTLGGYSLVVVADVAVLSSAAARRLVEYVEGGGSVLATLGTQLGDSSTPLLEGWRIGAARSGATKVGEIATTHPVLREAGDWHHIRFFRERPVVPASDDKVLIAHEDGAPLLIEQARGAGRMLVLTQPIARDWNDVAIHPLFVRFIAEAARYLAGGDAAAVSSTVGSIVLTGLTAAAGGQIFDPQGTRVLGLAQTTDADRLIPEQTGFYEIRGSEDVRWLAVNVDTRESDLTTLPATFVQRWQAMRMREPAPAAAATPSEPPPARSLGPLLLWLAALLLLAELLLANRHLAIRREVPR